MNRVKPIVAALAVLGCACGPRAGDDSQTDAAWLIGVYSLQAPTTDAADSIVTRYVFEAGGAAAKHSVSFDRIVEERPLTWVLAGSDREAHVYPDPYSENEDLWYKVRPGADCNTLEFTHMYPSGGMQGPAPLYRGEVCARQPDPEGFPTNFERYWCNEPPPPCDDT